MLGSDYYSIKKYLNRFDNYGDKFKLIDLYDTIYKLFLLEDITEYPYDEDKFDDIFEKHAKHISKYFLKIIKLDTIQEILIDRIDLLFPYLSIYDLTILEEIIKKKNENDIYLYQLHNIKKEKLNIIKLGEKSISPWLINNDENIMKEIIDYI